MERLSGGMSNSAVPVNMLVCEDLRSSVCTASSVWSKVQRSLHARRIRAGLEGSAYHEHVGILSAKSGSELARTHAA